MEVAFGITGKDYVLFASDTSANRSIVRMKADEDKQKVIGKHLVMAYMGEPGDTVQFAEYVERNLRLYQIRYAAKVQPSPLTLLATNGSADDTTPFRTYPLVPPLVMFVMFNRQSTCAYRNHIPLRPASAASWTRNQLAASIRSRKPYAVQLLLGGFDPTTNSPDLFWIDLYGTLGTVPYAAHGYGAYFSLSTMDRWHSPDMDLAQGLDLLRKCVDELEKRFIVNLGTFTVRVADKDGVRQVDLKTGETIEKI